MGFVSAVGLYVLVSIFSSGTESDARWKILAIAFGAGVAQAAMLAALPSIAGVVLALVASVAFVVTTLMFWCGVERKAALKIAGSYFVLSIGLAIFAEWWASRG